MKILVTGAAGLIGSHLCDKLIECGYSVIGIDNLSYGNMSNITNSCKSKNFSFILDDVENLHNYTFDNIDTVFHLAAYKKAPKDADITASHVMHGNFNMMQSVTNLCQKYKAKLIFTSTSDIYGNSIKFDESEAITIGPPTNERYSYSVSKLFDEQYILNLHKEKKIKILIFRLFGCFSERSNRGWSGGHIPMFIDKAMHGEDIIIHGDGLQTRSMCDALDIVEGLYNGFLNFDKIQGEIINIGSTEEMSVLSVANLILELTKSKSKIVKIPANEIFGDYKEIKRRFANIEKAKCLIQFKVKNKTVDVIKRMILNYAAK